MGCPAGLAERMTAVIGSVLLVVGLLSCQQPVSVPEELIGRWTTLAPGYKDRYLSITTSTITFGIGSGSADAQPIRQIDVSEQQSLILYTVVYGLDREDEQSLSFYYDPNQRVITFRNQPQLFWKKTPPG